MEVMISINPPYSNMIFDGYKPYEFRNCVLKGMDEGYPIQTIKAYIYETKNKGGKGAVIGEVTILGSSNLYYGKKVGLTTELINERYEFTKNLYLFWCELKNIKPNMNEGWFKSKKYHEYEKEIGLFGQNDELLSFNHALILDSPIKYDKSKPLTEYFNSKGEILKRPPQNMFNVLSKVVT